MNRSQRLVLLLGGMVLIANFVFPYTRYPARKEEPQLSVKQHHGFVPIWQTLAAQGEEPEFNHPSGYPAIQWRYVILIAFGILIVTGGLFQQLSSKMTLPTSQTPTA